MQNELKDYKANVDETISGVRYLTDVNSKLKTSVTVANFVVGQLKKINKTTDQAEKSIEVTDVVLKVLGFVPALKAPVRSLKKVLDDVEKPVDKIDEKTDELNSKDDTSVPGNDGKGEFLTKIETNLTSAGTKLDGVAIELRDIDIKLTTVSNAMAGFLPAMEMATQSGRAWSGIYDPLNAAVEAQFALSNDAYDSLKDFYDRVKVDVDLFLDVMVDIDFEEIFGSFVDLDSIIEIFDFLEDPLDVAAGLIKPIQPLLNAIDALVALIVDPIIEYITETLKIDDLMDKVTDQITALLPSLDVLDKFAELGQQLLDYLREFTLDQLEIPAWVADIEDILFGGNLGIPDLGPTGWGNNLINTLVGDDGVDVLDALGGRDFILAGGGDDVIVAGLGSDVIDGGAGADLFYFDASFGEYELSRLENTDTFFFSHLVPVNPSRNLGVDTLVELQDADHVAFTDISFTGEELKNAIIGGSVLNGDSDDNLMFLNSSGQTVNGFHVANGFAGDDRIFGSTQNDQLNGGAGDDVLLPGQGDDEINGGSGRDTFQVLSSAPSGMRVTLVEGRAIGQGRDTLSSIENLIFGQEEDNEIEASSADNTIFTDKGEDVITALGGDDYVDSGGENDFVIAGQGRDTVRAGDGRDVMISGSVAVAGVSDLYQGGNGIDTLTYTSTFNTIVNEIQSIDTPSLRQKLKDFMEDVPDSGPVEIRADRDEVLRFDLAGNHIATDRTEGVEQFMGSDLDDVLYGSVNTRLLHGAEGADVLFSGGSQIVEGGLGDDLLRIQEVVGGAIDVNVDGNSGFDILNLEEVSDARWYYNATNTGTFTLKAFKTSVQGESLQDEGDAFFTVRPKDVEDITLGNFADHVKFEPDFGSDVVFHLLDGDDFFQGRNKTATVFAGDGDDRGDAFGMDRLIFHGESGNDSIYLSFNDDNSEVFMGADQDFVDVSRFEGFADGGEGFDTITFRGFNRSNMHVDLAAGTAFSSRRTGSFEPVDMTLANFESVIGTDFGDVLRGSAADEQLIGRAGSDNLEGRGGRDKIYGGDGNDIMLGEDGDDLLHGGFGNDTLNGGLGNDTASYSWVAPQTSDGGLVAEGFGGVTVDLAAGTVSGTFGVDTLISIENIFGSDGRDILTGNAGDNMLSGQGGNDVLNGNDGDDVLVTGSGFDIANGGAGDDTVVVGIGTKVLSGGDGIDTLDFGTVSGSVMIDFNDGSYTATLNEQAVRWLQLDTDGDGIDDSDGTEGRFYNGTLLTPQMVREADPVYANDSGDVARVLPGPEHDLFDMFLLREIDVPVASSGVFTSFERVVGGNSGATLLLTSGIDRFDGRNSMQDVIDLSSAGQAISYNMQTGANNVTLLVGDEITDIEGLTGGAQDDVLTGDNVANILKGGGGADVLKGAGGADLLSGNAGQDFLRGGFDNDTIRGGADDDKVYGDAGNDGLHGDDGDDFLFGGAGDDYLNGGAGIDTASYRFATGGVTADLRNTGRTEIGGGEGRDQFNGIENLEGSDHRDMLIGDTADNALWGGGSRDELWGQEGQDKLRGGGGDDLLRGGQGQDNLRGDTGNDHLFGNRDDDLLDGGWGNDILDGGLGYDTVSYATSNKAVHVDLRYSGRDVGGDQGRDTFISIENLTGTRLGDRLSGDGATNTIRGGDGNDILKSFGGDDTLMGEAGNDILIGADGDDLLLGGDGDDILYALAGNDILRGQDGDDFLSGGRDVDLLEGGNGADVLRGNLGDDDLDGGRGNDDLRGGGNADRIDGASGDDFIFGDNGADVIIGGAGDDVLRGGSSGSQGDGFADVFVFARGSGSDSIRDFEDGRDKLDLREYGFASFAEVQALAQERPSGLKIMLDGASEVFIDAMTLAQFTIDDLL